MPNYTCGSSRGGSSRDSSYVTYPCYEIPCFLLAYILIRCKGRTSNHGRCCHLWLPISPEQQTIKIISLGGFSVAMMIQTPDEIACYCCTTTPKPCFNVLIWFFPPFDPFCDWTFLSYHAFTDTDTNINIDPFRNRGLPSYGRSVSAFPRHGVSDLRTQPDLGKPHPHLQERWFGGQEVPLLQPGDCWTRLRG